MRVDYLTHPSIMPPPALLGATVICFTGTKVHILTQKALAARLLVPLCASANASHGAHTHVRSMSSIFGSINVTMLGATSFLDP